MNPAIFDLAPNADVVVERCAAGTVLFTEGEPSRGLYVLYSGDVDLMFSTRNGDVKRLRVAEAGRVLGLDGFVSGIEHSCTAIARTSCVAGFMTRQAFRGALDRTPSLWMDVLRVLSHEVGAAYEDLRGLTIRQPQRFARTLSSGRRGIAFSTASA